MRLCPFCNTRQVLYRMPHCGDPECREKNSASLKRIRKNSRKAAFVIKKRRPKKIMVIGGQWDAHIARMADYQEVITRKIKSLGFDAANVSAATVDMLLQKGK